jgi:SsrA-binding protein
MHARRGAGTARAIAPHLIGKYFQLSMSKVFKNKKAFHEYEILEKFEAGIELRGMEVKSIRAGKLAITDSYAQCAGGEVVLKHLHIAPYQTSGSFAADPYRPRKLLLHRREIFHLCSEVERKKLTIIPLSVYFSGKQKVKVEIALCRGKRAYDKRRKIAERENKLRLAQVLRGRFR